MRAEKQLLLDEIKEKIEASNGFIVTNYQLTSGRARDFRAQIQKADGEFEVVRKKIFLKALEKCGIPFQVELEGHIGVVFMKGDVASLSKATVQFGADNDKAVQVLCGQIDGNICSADEVVELSNLPSLDVLRAQLLAVLEAPMGEVVSTIDSLLTSVLHCLEEKSTKEEQ